MASKKYQSYIKIILIEKNPNIFLENVYCLQENKIIDVVKSFKFKVYLRMLINRFFVSQDVAKKGANTNNNLVVQVAVVVASKTTINKHTFAKSFRPLINKSTIEHIASMLVVAPKKLQVFVALKFAKVIVLIPILITINSNVLLASIDLDSDSIASKAIALLARETTFDSSKLNDDANFANLEMNSLISLVMAKKFRDDLDVVINDSLFLEYLTIGDLRR